MICWVRLSFLLLSCYGVSLVFQYPDLESREMQMLGSRLLCTALQDLRRANAEAIRRARAAQEVEWVDGGGYDLIAVPQARRGALKN